MQSKLQDWVSKGKYIIKLTSLLTCKSFSYNSNVLLFLVMLLHISSKHNMFLHALS
jgi:hypothetical protein